MSGGAAGRRRVEPAPLEQVGAVDAGRAHADEHLARAGPRVGVLLDEDLSVADGAGAHGGGVYRPRQAPRGLEPHLMTLATPASIARSPTIKTGEQCARLRLAADEVARLRLARRERVRDVLRDGVGREAGASRPARRRCGRSRSAGRSRACACSPKLASELVARGDALVPDRGGDHARLDHGDVGSHRARLRDAGCRRSIRGPNLEAA